MRFADAFDVAAAVRSGRVTAVEVLNAHLDVVAERNDDVNAIVALRAAGAREDAEEVDRSIRAGRNPGVLAGVPFTVKDVLSTLELPTTCGSRALANHYTESQADVIAQIRQAGGVLLGKTNTPEFAFGIHTMNELHGTTLNPTGPCTVGGSSGGEAAAVASGMSAFGIGTDFGGSLRWPSQCTALVGFRPEVGTVSAAGSLPEQSPDSNSLQGAVQVVGPLARSVRDIELIIGVIGLGPAGRRSLQSSVAQSDLTSRARVLVGTALDGMEPDPEVAQGMAFAAQALVELGLRVENSLPAVLDRSNAVYDELRVSENHDGLLDLVGDRLDLVEDRNARLLRPLAHVDTAHGWRRRAQLIDELDDVMGDDTLLALPVSNRAPVRPSWESLEAYEILRPCRAVSLFGLPSLALPWTRTVDGRPLSVQLVGPRGGTQLLLDVARKLEAIAHHTEAS